MRDYFDAGVDSFVFSDGTMWSDADVRIRLLSTPGDDVITGDAGANLIDGGAGNDTLWGGDGDDTLLGGPGDDTLEGQNQSDTLDGGPGTDRLIGGAEDDTYRWGRGDGADTLNDIGWRGSTADRMLFKAGVSLGDLVVTRSGNDLVVSIQGTTDSIRVLNHFTDAQNRIEFFDFSDGSRLTAASMEARIVQSGTSGPDTLYGDAGANLIDGGAGNDTLWGGDGDDTLLGGLGDDTLEGQNQSDTLDGGPGTDRLVGGAEDDTYRWGRGDGADTINDIGWRGSTADRVLFKAGVSLSDLVVTRSGNDLVVAIQGTTDSIRVTNHFTDAANKIEFFDFGDGTRLTAANMEARITQSGPTLSGTAGADTLDGTSTAETISGGGGDDLLKGGAGSDTYLYGVGDGHDIIVEGRHRLDVDKIVFGPGLTSTSVILERGTADSFDLVIRFAGQQGSITLDNYLEGAPIGVERLEFADGVVWGKDQIAIALTAGSANRVLLGGVTPDLIYGGPGDDWITGGDEDPNAPQGQRGEEALNWGAPAAALFGGAGDDVLIGGAGFDEMLGEAGDDLFIVDQDGGGGYDGYDGGAGSDTVSYERFTLRNPNQTEWHGWSLAPGYASTHVDGVVAYLGNRGQFGWNAEVRKAYGDALYLVENLTGTEFNDYLAGDEAANVLRGLLGDDLIEGQGGDDTIEGGGGADLMAGNAGTDTASYASSKAGVTVDLATGTGVGGDAQGDRLREFENLVGSSFNDDLRGDGGANIIQGGGGADVLFGGAGADRFVFTSLADSGGAAVDRIADFLASAGDVIDLSRIDANPAVTGDQAFVFVSAFSGAAGQAVLAYAAATDTTRLSLDVDGDSTADFVLDITGQVGSAAGWVL